MKIILRPKQPDGIAIFIVLVAILVLSSMAGVFAYNMRVETKLAMNSNNETEMEWLARSGVEYAKWVKIFEESQAGPAQRFDALNQLWAGGPGGTTNEALAGIDLKQEVHLGNGSFKVKMTDADRKFNINAVANNEALMTQSLILIGTDASEIPTIIGSIQDWIDVGNEMRVNGAESDYYQSLDVPYLAKNGPIDDMSEMLLIKGITPEIYWGPNSTNHPTTIFQARTPGTRSGLLPTTPVVSAGLVDIFTAIGGGSQINLNTASATTLRMTGMDDATANRLVALRAGPDGMDGTEDDAPFSSPGEIINAGIPNNLVSLFTPYLMVRSTTFELQIDVTVGQSKRRYYAIIKRTGGRDFQTLGLHWE